jgi:hypothetical protein
MQNPYESPTTENENLAESRQLPFDIGKVTGLYLQLLAVYIVGSMLVDWLVFGRDWLDLNFIFLFAAGVALRAHSNVARRWVIGISAVVVVSCIGTTVTAFLYGTEGMSLRVWRRIDNPTFSDVVVVSIVLLVLAGVPLVLLLTRQARLEFAKPLRANIDRG